MGAVRYNHFGGYRFWPVSLGFVILMLAGCATKQDVLRVDERVGQIRNDQLLLRGQVHQIDSLTRDGAVQDNQLRAEIRASLDELNQQLSQMQNQINDMQQMVYTMSQRAPGQTAPTIPIVSPLDSAKAGDSTAATTSVDCRTLWDDAFKDMYRGQYELAIAGFSDYLKYCPNGDLTDNSQYWIAEAYYELEQHDKAIAEYTRLLDQYPQSEKRPAAYFKLGRTYEKMADTTKALDNFLILKKDFPESVEYQQVKEKVEAWQKRKKR